MQSKDKLEYLNWNAAPCQVSMALVEFKTFTGSGFWDAGFLLPPQDPRYQQAVIRLNGAIDQANRYRR